LTMTSSVLVLTPGVGEKVLSTFALIKSVVKIFLGRKFLFCFF
jgi:hypothetical protein